MSRHIKVYLTGRDFVNWATDDDYFFTRKAISLFAEVTDKIEKADVIHSVNWHSLLSIGKNILKSKTIISHIPHDVRHMLSRPEYLLVAPYVDYWIVPSSTAKKYTDLLSLPNMYIPYGIDNSIFHKIEDKSVIKKLKEKYSIPFDKYLIGSFQRDTEGADLKTPKYIKGPDLFLEIIKKAYENCKDIHVILSGPRRFWLRNKLKEEGIPFTFIGRLIEGRDDLTENTLDRKAINELYNLIDLYIVSSRMEGGPKAVLECASSQTKIISTDVGHAKDILDENQIYDNFIPAADLVLEDIRSGHLRKFVGAAHARTRHHSLENISVIFSNFYDAIPIKKKHGTVIFKGLKVIKETFRDRIFKRTKFEKKATIFFQFRKPPWGGGNQFLLALSEMLKKKGWNIDNSVKSSSKVFLFNSFHISSDDIKKLKHKDKLIIHRIDGPTILVRGKDKELDDKIFSVNSKIADLSVFQSAWSLTETFKMGYKPVNPLIIPNASDPHIFNSGGSRPFSAGRKLKLISSSWSDNPNKGGPLYGWLDKNLDWDRFEYTFVGRVSVNLTRINIVEPVSSEKLAEILKLHDVYITASSNDPCSNALIEALSCKLPVLYLNKGGHPELVGYGGLGFNQKEDITTLLDVLREHYDAFRNMIVPPGMEAISERYAACMELSYGDQRE